MNKIKFEVHNTKDFSDVERQKFLIALDLATVVLNSKEFRERALALELEQTEGLTASEVYWKLMSGVDNFNKEVDADIDVYITMYYSFKNTVGYTYPSTWYTWINRKFFSRFDSAEIAGNVVHEYMHNLGFGHKSARDKKSVPYAYGYLVRDMLREWAQQPTPKPPVTAPDEAVKTTPSIWSRVARFFRNLF